jgi:uncharacterized protein (DUF488 family)
MNPTLFVEDDPEAPHRREGRVVYMVGHSKHPWPTFAKLLTSHGVQLLVDVRTSPQSRFSPQFSQTALKRSLSALQFDYQHVPVLGGKDPVPLDVQRDTLATLVGTFNSQVTALMCSEANYRECHRHYTLTPLVIEAGFTVQQILPDGSLEQDYGPTSATLKKMAQFLPPR